MTLMSKKNKDAYDLTVPIEAVIALGEVYHPKKGVVATILLTGENSIDVYSMRDIRNSISLTMTKFAQESEKQRKAIPFLLLTGAQLIKIDKSPRFYGMYEAQIFGDDWAGFDNFELDTPLLHLSMWGDSYR